MPYFILLEGDETSVEAHAGRTLRLGRGSRANLRFTDAAIALEHAVIEQDDQGWVLLAASGAAAGVHGVFVNGERVTTRRLENGDRIHLGRYRLAVEIQSPEDPLSLDVTRIGDAASSEPLPAGAPILRNRRPPPAIVAACFTLAAAAMLGVVLLAGGSGIFSPGLVTTFHRDAACADCHASWQEVGNNGCLASGCHDTLALHQEGTAKPEPCLACHVEHHGVDALALLQPDGACPACHGTTAEDGPPARLTVPLGGAKGGNTALLPGEHPEFTPRKSAQTLKFSHGWHLGLPDVELHCADCHAGDPQGDFVTVSFDDHCGGCHALATGDQEVAHGQPVEGDVGREVCGVCHRLAPSSAPTPVAVLATRVGERWHEQAVFRHAPHADLGCTECHRLAYSPKIEADVQLPELEFCADCHRPTAGGMEESTGPTDCLSCHLYHQGR